MEGDMDMQCGKCGCSHHKAMPVLVVLFGVLFLLGSLNVVTPDLVGTVWPIIVILGGLSKLMSGSCKCC